MKKVFNLDIKSLINKLVAYEKSQENQQQIDTVTGKLSYSKNTKQT